MENNSNLRKCPDTNKINVTNNVEILTNNPNENNKTDSQDSKDIENKIKEDQNLQMKINQFKEIKEFLSKNANDQEYSNKIKDNPDSLFEKMHEQRIIIWESTLYTSTSPSRKNSDSDILYSTLDRTDQKVIRNDCKRTRVRESILIPGYAKILEAMLTYYCSTKNICYKQGLNEVFGALVLLQFKFKNMKLSKLYDIGEVLIDQYLPNYFYEKEIYSLESSLYLFVILLKYHEPSVYNRFDSNEIMPQMYATNNIITLMSGKLKINMVYELWERIIQSKDPLMIHFILVAHFITHREMIINCEKMYLAILITTLSINTIEDLNNIMNLAFQLREKTPYSYRILANKIGFLKTNNKLIKNTYDFYKPQSIPAMPIFPLEIISITNKFTEECVDPDCFNCVLNKNYNKNFDKKDYIFKWEDDDFEISEGFLKFEKHRLNHICEKCDMKIEKKMQYILLDLRILNYDEEDDDTEKTGFLPMMINVNQEELKSEDFNKIITNRFVGERGNYHFIFLTSSTDTFSDFENKYYTENMSELDKKKMMFGLIKQRKIDKTLNLEDAQKNLTWKEIYKLKEYDNFRNILRTMQKENFPYVGYVYDGFNEVHDMSIRHGYELLFHNENNCILCLNKRNKGTKKKISKKEKENEEKIKNEIYGSLWEHKTKIIYSKINEIYNGRKITTFLCILIKYKNKKYSNDRQQVLIILLHDEFSVEFFKFNTKKEYRELQIQKDIKEKRKKISEYYDLGKEKEDANKETELILFDKIHINEVKTLNMDKKSRNIIHIVIVDYKEKNPKKQDLNNYEIILDFSSTNDSKDFAKCFKNMVNDYRRKNG